MVPHSSFPWVLETWTQVLMLSRRAHYQLSYHSSLVFHVPLSLCTYIVYFPNGCLATYTINENFKLGRCWWVKNQLVAHASRPELESPEPMSGSCGELPVIPAWRDRQETCRAAWEDRQETRRQRPCLSHGIRWGSDLGWFLASTLGFHIHAHPPTNMHTHMYAHITHI